MAIATRSSSLASRARELGVPVARKPQHIRWNELSTTDQDGAIAEPLTTEVARAERTRIYALLPARVPD